MLVFEVCVCVHSMDPFLQMKSYTEVQKFV